MARQPTDAFDQYDGLPGRHYLGLETDSPERWLTFVVSHPQFKPHFLNGGSYTGTLRRDAGNG